MRTLLLLVLAVWSTLAWAATVDLNTATQAQLEDLPGLGPSKAAAILQYRTDHGPFTSVAQLDNVPGIGPATLTNLQGLVAVGPGDGTAATAAPAETAGGVAAPAESAPATTVSASSGGKININTATAAQLEDLPGIGPSKAAAILEYRTQHGAFSSCQGLSSVNGIGPATLTALLDSCTVQ